MRLGGNVVGLRQHPTRTKSYISPLNRIYPHTARVRPPVGRKKQRKYYVTPGGLVLTEANRASTKNRFACMACQIRVRCFPSLAACVVEWVGVCVVD